METKVKTDEEILETIKTLRHGSGVLKMERSEMIVLQQQLRAIRADMQEMRDGLSRQETRLDAINRRMDAASRILVLSSIEGIEDCDHAQLNIQGDLVSSLCSPRGSSRG